MLDQNLVGATPVANRAHHVLSHPEDGRRVGADENVRALARGIKTLLQPAITRVKGLVAREDRLKRGDLLRRLAELEQRGAHAACTVAGSPVSSRIVRAASITNAAPSSSSTRVVKRPIPRRI